MTSDYNDMIIMPSSLASVTVDLSKCAKESTDVYYVSPIIYYKTEENNYQIALNYFTSGFNISKEELHHIGDKIEW